MSTTIENRIVAALHPEALRLSVNEVNRIVERVSDLLPRWRKADPEDPSTWPEDDALTFVVLTYQLDGRIVMRDVADSSDARHRIESCAPQDRQYGMRFHWMPWSEIGDPT